MYSYEAVRNVYVHLQDEASKYIFLKRLEYSLSGKKRAIEEIVNEEMERYASLDIMNRLLSWLEKHPGEVTVFGAGFAGSQICSVLRRHHIKVGNIADNNRHLWDGAEIVSPDSINRDNMVIIGVNSCVEEILGQLVSLGISREHIFVPDKQWWVGETPQYFDPEILHPGTDEVFVDGGSLDGGDSLNFIKWCKGAYKAIYAFEPDAQNYEKLCCFTEKYPDMKVFKEGLWSDEKELCFLTGKRENCAISDTGNTIIRVTSIDKKLKGFKPTFIKMDIEGSEMEALCGAEDMIRQFKPKLAICVYHKPEDILDIPQKILELNTEYRLYLRHYSYVDTETVLYAV